MKQWNSNGGTVSWNSGTVMVQQCGGTIEQSWWNCGTLVVEQGNETVKQSWWNIMVEQWNIVDGTVWWNSTTVMVEKCGGKVKQSWWNSGTVMV